MALLLFDGFDYSTSISLFSVKWRATPQIGITLASTGGRNGKGVMNIAGTSGTTGIFRPSYNDATYILGFAVKFTTMPGSNSGIASMYDTSTTSHATLYLTSSGDIILRRDNDNVILATVSGAIAANIWYHIQWKYSPSNSCAANSNILKINNTEVFNLAATTQTTTRSNHFNNGFMLGMNIWGYGTYVALVDDFWALDSSGTILNDFIGDCYVDYQKPASNGYYNQFSPTGTASNYLAAQDNNGDTSYCSSDQNYRQAFNLDTIGAAMSAVKALQVCTTMRKEGAGSHNVKNLLRISSVDYEGLANSIGSGYSLYIDTFPQNPATSADWVQVDLTSLQAGIRVTS